MGRYANTDTERCSARYRDGRNRCDDRVVYAIVSGALREGNIPGWTASCRQHLARVVDAAQQGHKYVSVVPYANLVKGGK